MPGPLSPSRLSPTTNAGTTPGSFTKYGGQVSKFQHHDDFEFLILQLPSSTEIILLPFISNGLATEYPGWTRSVPDSNNPGGSEITAEAPLPIMDLIRRTIAICQSVPLPLLVLFLLTTLVGVVVLVSIAPLKPPRYFLLSPAQSYLALFIVAPIPRAPLSHERTFRCIEPDGMISDAKRLPCWQDMYNTHKRTAQRNGDFSNSTRIDVEEAEVFMSLVVPAYNEEERLGIMLTEAVEYLQREYEGTEAGMNPLQGNGVVKQRAKDMKERGANGHTHAPSSSSSSEGWEILIVSDGSTDKTVQTALQFARGLGAKRCASIRVVSLQENRGKGGAVTHGMRHVRGKYAIFADADGASKFEDLGKLLRACKQIEDKEGRGVAVGSRAHLVGSEAVVKVCTYTSRYICMRLRC